MKENEERYEQEERAERRLREEFERWQKKGAVKYIDLINLSRRERGMILAQRINEKYKG